MTNPALLKSSNGRNIGGSEGQGRFKDKRSSFSSGGSTSPKKTQQKISTARGSSPTHGRSPKLTKSDPGHPLRGLEARGNNAAETNSAKKSNKAEFDGSFLEYDCLGQRLKKTMYFANKLPSTTRPSFPLTMLAVNAFTSGHLAGSSQLEFLDMEMASEIGRNACVSPTALIMALVYLDRLSNHNPNYLASVKPSELFVVALLVASKFIQDEGEDNCIYNDEWAASAKLETKEINRLEIKFLGALDWKVNVSPDEFNVVLQRIEENLAADQGTSRGWFTYTELEKMSNSLVTWKLIWPTVYYYAVQVVTAATITYATILTTILTSSILVPHIYFLSHDLLASTGAGYRLGFPWMNSNTGHCINFNDTQPLMFAHHENDETQPDSSSPHNLDFDQINLELGSNEEDVNGTHLNIAYFPNALNANHHQRYSQPHEGRHNYLSHHVKMGHQNGQWGKQRSSAPTTLPETTFSIYKLNGIMA